MTLKLVMNADGTLGHGSGSPISGGAFVITSSPSTNVKASGKGVYRGNLQYTFSGGNATGFVAGTVETTATQSIPPTAVNVKADGSLVIREGDFATMNCEGELTGGGTGPVSGPVEVKTAGQVVVKGD